MGVVNYAGDLSVAVVLLFRGETVSGALGSSSHHYAVANESLTEFEIRGQLGATTYRIARRAGAGRRLFDESLNTYVSGPVSGADLDALLDGSPTWRIDLTFSYRTFFDVLLEHMTAGGGALENVAKPADSSRILSTFTRDASGGSVSIRYDSATERITNLPLTLADFEVTPGRGGGPPAVKLVFELDFLTGIDDTKRAMMRKLVAMDWSKLARYGQPAATPPVYVSVWWNNVYNYLLNGTTLTRGRAIFDQIKSANKARTALALSTSLRDNIDSWIVTANHWGEARESLTTERHQRFLSDLFGSLHQSAWLASPVCFMRELQDALSLSLEDTAALVFTYGAGHCGEHAICSYTLLKAIIDETGGREVSHVVFTGNANIDHAFVVYNLDVETVVRTVTTASNNTRVGGAGRPIHVWNLREAIAKNDPRKGYVMDPYLDPSVMRATAEELLAALHSSRRRSARKDTDYLAFELEHPASYRIEDISTQDEATRRARVPNV